MRSAIVERPIVADALLAEVQRHANGASVLFIGTVRELNEGRPVSGMEYTAYGAMAARELQAILVEAGTQFGTDDLVAEHRIGELGLGEISVAIVAAHPHRAPAFAACRYVIEALKQRVPVWKREHYTDGSRAWVDPTASASAAP